MNFSVRLFCSAVLILGFTLFTYPQTKRASVPRIRPITVEGLKEVLRRDSGKVVLVNTWATWCKPCREELPGLLKLRKEHSSQEFELVLVSADDTDIVEKSVRPLLGTLGVDFPSYIMDDSSSEAFMAKLMPDWDQAIALPTSFLYDKHGNLAGRFVGGRTHDQFDTRVTKLLGESR